MDVIHHEVNVRWNHISNLIALTVALNIFYLSSQHQRIFLLPIRVIIFGKVMFSQECVSHSVHRRDESPWQRPLDRDPRWLCCSPGQRPPGQWPFSFTENTSWTETPLDRDPTGQRPPLPHLDRSPCVVKIRWYASYWNAFFF